MASYAKTTKCPERLIIGAERSRLTPTRTVFTGRSYEATVALQRKEYMLMVPVVTGHARRRSLSRAYGFFTLPAAHFSSPGFSSLILMQAIASPRRRRFSLF